MMFKIVLCHLNQITTKVSCRFVSRRARLSLGYNFIYGKKSSSNEPETISPNFNTELSQTVEVDNELGNAQTFVESGNLLHEPNDFDELSESNIETRQARVLSQQSKRKRIGKLEVIGELVHGIHPVYAAL